jgi:hypothetical protein
MTILAAPGPANSVRVSDVTAALLPQRESVSGVVTVVTQSSITVGGKSYKLTKDTQYLLESGRDPFEVKGVRAGQTVDLSVEDGEVVRVFIWRFGK